MTVCLFQIINLFSSVDSPNELIKFFVMVADEIEYDEPPGTLLKALTPTFDLVGKDLADANILTFPRTHFSLLRVFSSIQKIATVSIFLIILYLLNLFLYY